MLVVHHLNNQMLVAGKIGSKVSKSQRTIAEALPLASSQVNHWKQTVMFTISGLQWVSRDPSFLATKLQTRKPSLHIIHIANQATSAVDIYEFTIHVSSNIDFTVCTYMQCVKWITENVVMIFQVLQPPKFILFKHFCYTFLLKMHPGKKKT